MADDRQHAPSDAGKLERPRLYTFDELAALAADNPLPRGRCRVQVDDTRDQISTWLDALSLRHPEQTQGRRGARPGRTMGAADMIRRRG